MHKPFRSLLLAALAMLAVCSIPAQTIIGAWSFGDPSIANSGSGVVVFLSNGYFFHAENADTGAAPTGFNGMERGTYSWNSGTGAMTLATLTDSNGDIGPSSIFSGALFSVSGNTLTITDADGPSTGSSTMSRVSDASTLVGAWSFGDPSVANSGSGVVVFLPNGYFYHAENADTGAAPTGFNGMERGTYLWTPGSGAMTLSTLTDSNGDIGPSSIFSGALFSVSGNTLTITDADGPSTGSSTMSRVSAIPEPSTYAALAGLGALGLAFWRRRRARVA